MEKKKTNGLEHVSRRDLEELATQILVDNAKKPKIYRKSSKPIKKKIDALDSWARLPGCYGKKEKI